MKTEHRSQTTFSCKKCEFELNADLNVAPILSDHGMTIIRWTSINRPNIVVVPFTETIQLLGRILATNN